MNTNNKIFNVVILTGNLITMLHFIAIHFNTNKIKQYIILLNTDYHNYSLLGNLLYNYIIYYGYKIREIFTSLLELHKHNVFLI